MPFRDAGNNGVMNRVRPSSFLNGPGVRCGTGWSLAWPGRIAGGVGWLADLAALVPLGLPGVPGPFQWRVKEARVRWHVSQPG